MMRNRHSARTSTLALLALCSAAISITGCHAEAPTTPTPRAHWPQVNFDAGRSNYNPRESIVNPANIDQLELLWSQRFSSSVRGQPTVTEDRAFFGLYGGQFFAMDVRTGETLWTVENKGKHSGQAVAGNVVYSSWINRVSALDARTGEEIWTWEPTEKGHCGSGLLDGETLYVPQGNNIRQLDVATGELQRTIEAAHSIAIAGDIAYLVGRSRDKVRAVNKKTGEEYWERPIECSKRISNLSVSTGVVVVASDLGRVHAFDAGVDGPNAGKLLWTGETKPNALDGVPSPAIAYGRVFFGLSDTFYCFDLKGSGGGIQKPLWTATTRSESFSASPTVANGIVYTTCGIDEVSAFDIADGTQLWTYKVVGSGHPMRSSVVVANGRVFVPSTFAFRMMVFHLP